MKFIETKQEEGSKEVKIYLTEISEKDALDKLKSKEIHIAQIIDPTVEVQKEGTKEISNIRFIRNIDIKVLLKKIEANPYSIALLRDPIRRVQLRAAGADGMCLEFIRNPDLDVRRKALKNNAFAAEFIDDYTEEELEIMAQKPESLRFAAYTKNKEVPRKYIVKGLSKQPSSITALYNARVVGAPLEDKELWSRCLSKDPYLAYFLTDEEQMEFIDDIMKGLKIGNNQRALGMLSKNAFDKVISMLSK